MGTEKNRGGRPPKWDAAVAALICEKLATTNETLPAVLALLKKAGKKTPSLALVYKWRAQNKEFRDQFRLAREQQAELDIDEAYRVARTSLVGEIVIKEKEKGRVVKEIVRTVDNVERSKLLVSTLFKRAALFNPARFGEKIDLALAGEVAVKRVVLDPKWRRVDA
jgi:hypothetical protein